VTSQAWGDLKQQPLLWTTDRKKKKTAHSNSALGKENGELLGVVKKDFKTRSAEREGIFGRITSMATTGELLESVPISWNPSGFLKRKTLSRRAKGRKRLSKFARRRKGVEAKVVHEAARKPQSIQRKIESERQEKRDFPQERWKKKRRKKSPGRFVHYRWCKENTEKGNSASPAPVKGEPL